MEVVYIEHRPWWHEESRQAVMGGGSEGGIGGQVQVRGE
jgi:hypothetical protein